MIRLVQRRLIVPRGDTGTFSIPTLAGKNSGDIAIFTVFDPLMHRKIFEKEMSSSNGALNINFTHNDTVNLPVGQYVWDIKFYTDPVIVDGKLVGGTEVDSYYSAFTLPICEIRETGDNMLMSDDAPTGALRPGQVDVITASIREIASLKQSAAESAAEADTSATNAESSASAAATSAQDALNSKVAALAAQQMASAASENAVSAAANAQASATLAAQRANEVMVELGTKANIEDLAAVAFSGLYSDLSGVPTRVSQFINDAGYLTQHQDISGKANLADLATVATSGSYNDLSNKPYIPQRVSDLQDDSGHYTKPATGIPASDLEETYLTSFTETDPTVPAWAKEATKPSYTPQEVGALPADTFIPSRVSDLTDDSGHYTKPVGGIPASDLAEIYLTQHQDISGKADKSEIPTLVSQLTNDAGYITGYTETDPTVPSWAKAAQKPTYTAAEVGAPTVQEMNTAIGTAIGNINSFDMAVVQALPTQDIDTHTIYLAPKTGETNDVYDEYVYINNAWEMVGNTQIDLSNYATKSEIPEVPVQDVQVNGNSILNNGTANIPLATSNGLGVVATGAGNMGINYNQNKQPYITAAQDSHIKAGTDYYRPITAWKQDVSVFYGLAKAAGDITQSVSTNAVGTYTTAAKEAIQQMLDVPSTSDIPEVPVQDVQINGTSILDAQGIANVPLGNSDHFGVFKTSNSNSGIMQSGGTLLIDMASTAEIKAEVQWRKPVTVGEAYSAAFYGLARASGDRTQKVSTNAVGTYTNEAKAAIQTMLDVPSNTDLALKADKTDTVLETTLSRGRKDNTTVGGASLAFGVDTEASGYYSVALGLNTTASSQGAFAEGKNTVARYIAHAEGEDTQALGQWAHSQGVGTVAKGAASFAGGDNTIANGHSSFVTGRYNAADSYDNWEFWAANTSYAVGDKVKRQQLVNNEPTIIGYICKEANIDETFDISHWDFDSNHMNYSVIIGNGYEAEDPETHQTVRHGSNAYALDWDGTARYMGDVYVGANADSTGGTRLATVTEVAAKLDAAEAGLKVVRLI